MVLTAARWRGATLGLCLALAAGATGAQGGYPARPLRLIVPFTPGGSADILARAVSQGLTEAWRQQVVIDNKPGAGGAIGAEAAAKAAPDGYTLFMGHIGTLAINPGLYPALAYDPVRDFAPVALVARVPNVLAIHPGVAAHSAREFIALAKAKPGALSYGSGGQGSAAHLAMESFRLATGIALVHVPYKGAAPAITDLVGGQVSAVMTGLPPLLPHVRAGKLRALGVTSTERLAQLPELPTLAESGVAGFEATQWYGIVVPARVPPAIVSQLGAEIGRALARPDMKRRLETEGALPSGAGAEAFGALIRTEINRWAGVIRAAGVKVE